MPEQKTFVIISTIRQMLDSCRKMPLTNGVVLVNKEELEGLLDELRSAIDPDVQKAEKLLEREHEILSELERRVQATEEKAAREAN